MFPDPGPYTMAGSTEIKEEYTSSLADLTFNSKPLINVLTILADEYRAHAKDIVEAIEAHLSRVRTEVKLPVLYLIDCIMKNVGDPYMPLFCQNIVSTFCSVFEQVDERTRSEMFRLRQTWNDVLPAKKLYALDVQIHQLDPAWPVTAQPPSNIHLNPKFLKTKPTQEPTIRKQPTTTTTTNTSSLLTSSNEDVNPDTINMQQKLIDKQRQLLELQQRKLELELLQTQVKLQEQKLKTHKVPKTVTSNAKPMPHGPKVLLKPEVAKQLINSMCTTKATSNSTATKSKATYVVSSTEGQNVHRAMVSSAPTMAPPVSGALLNARPTIRDPRLLRQQQPASAAVNSNVLLESKSKSGTQNTLNSDNKIVNSKLSVRNTGIEPRLVNNNNKNVNEPQGKSKTMPSSPPSKSSTKRSTSASPTKLKPRISKSSPSDSAKSESSPIKRKSIKSRSPGKNQLKSRKKEAASADKKDSHRDFEKGNGTGSRFEKDIATLTKDPKDSRDGKSIKSDTSFKDLKGLTKNRNYVRRNRNTSLSPEPSGQDIDLRLQQQGPPEKQARLRDSLEERSDMTNATGKDVDLRRIPTITKKRPSAESVGPQNPKKTKAEMMDIMFSRLFGSEDTDLRQLIPPLVSTTARSERLATPPPPPIISDSSEKESERKPVNPSLQAVRAKLYKDAKIKPKDLLFGTNSVHADIVNKIVISPADEECIKAGNMTKTQEAALMNKIIAQIELHKSKEKDKLSSENEAAAVEFSSDSDEGKRKSKFSDREDWTLKSRLNQTLTDRFGFQRRVTDSDKSSMLPCWRGPRGGLGWRGTGPRRKGFGRFDKPAVVRPSNILGSTVTSTSSNTEERKAANINDNIGVANTSIVAAPVPILPPAINVNDLFQRLVDTGIVATVVANPSPPPLPVPPPTITSLHIPEPPKYKPPIPRTFKPISFDNMDNLKRRRSQVISALYSGMQCSSCGMRFPAEQSMYYSQHLDWHFRQNRKGKKSMRRTASRLWYYGLEDWKNYEELEDLEDREKCYFENQKQAQGKGSNEEEEEEAVEADVPCIPADPDVQDASCEVCRDKLEQFYNEEKDEWQLRMACRVDGKTFHPLCYEDYQASMVDAVTNDDESKVETKETGSECNGIPGLEAVDSEQEKIEDETKNSECDLVEVIDNSNELTNVDNVDDQKDEEQDNDKVVEEEEVDDDVILNEVAPERIVIDDDGNDAPEPDGLIPGVVVKQEPVDDGFMDVDNILVKRGGDTSIKTEPLDPDKSKQLDEEQNKARTAIVDNNLHPEYRSSIDGNTEVESKGVPPATSSVGGRIKINITKPIVSVAVPKDTTTKESNDDGSGAPQDAVDPSQPLPPGEEPVQLNLKQPLQGVSLKKMPVVKKGAELTGLCSIM